jgi:hypothetical protein
MVSTPLVLCISCHICTARICARRRCSSRVEMKVIAAAHALVAHQAAIMPPPGAKKGGWPRLAYTPSQILWNFEGPYRRKLCGNLKSHTLLCTGTKSNRCNLD